MARSIRSGMLFLPVAAVMALLLVKSAVAAEAVRQGLALCVRAVIPSLFSFFVAVSFAVNTGLFHTLRSWGIPTGAAVFVLGALGGYPLGGRTAGEAYNAGLLSKIEAERLLACCNNAGPAFILSVAGQSVFGSTSIGLALWGVHLAVALGLFFLFYRSPRREVPLSPPVSSPMTAFISAVGSAAETMLHLCAFVVLFTVVMALLGNPPPLVAGILELTVGITSLSPHRAGFTMAAAFLGWGGVSVHCQTAAVLSATDLSLRRYLLGKALHSIVSTVAAWWLYPLL